MPRNGSGSMSVTNTFTPSTIISSSQVNANFTDIADQLTNSLAADGQTTMLASIKGANGSAAAPSYGFAADPDTGVYRKGANELGFSVAGVEVGYFDATGLHITGDILLTDDLTIGDDCGVLGDFFVTGAISGAGTIEIGHASDTTLARASAGNLTVEGNALYRAGGTDVAIADGGTGASTAAAAFAALKQAASDTATGVVELANAAEMEAGTDTLRVVTPALQQFHPGSLKAWIKWDGTNASAQASYGVTSIAEAGAGIGDFLITWATAFSSANYAASGSCGANSGLARFLSVTEADVTATTFRVTLRTDAGVAQDLAWASVMAAGDL